MPYVIAEPCVDIKDKRCVEECPVDAIYEGERMLYIQPDECIDCSACEMVCPVEAIYYRANLPEQWRHYAQLNADFFSDLGSPGGASRVGATDNDPPAVMALPPLADLNRRHKRRSTTFAAVDGDVPDFPNRFVTEIPVIHAGQYVNSVSRRLSTSAP